MRHLGWLARIWVAVILASVTLAAGALAGGWVARRTLISDDAIIAAAEGLVPPGSSVEERYAGAPRVFFASAPFEASVSAVDVEGSFEERVELATTIATDEGWTVTDFDRRQNGGLLHLHRPDLIGRIHVNESANTHFAEVMRDESVVAARESTGYMIGAVVTVVGVAVTVVYVVRHDRQPEDETDGPSATVDRAPL